MKSALFTSYHDLKKKDNNRRIWLEGEPLLRAGFIPGDYYQSSMDLDTLSVTLSHVPDSLEARELHKKRQVHKISRRQMNGWVKPIIDICNAEITSLFGEACRFRAQAFTDHIIFSIHPEDAKRIKRESRLLNHINDGYITKGDAFVGIGVSTHAIHEGFKRAGLKTQQKWAVEIDARYLDVACQNNPSIFKHAHMFVSSVEEVEKDLLEPVDAFGFSMPCTNHSAQGVTKKMLKNAEEGGEVTALFGTIAMIQAVNPAILFSENVPRAKGSVTYNILLKELTRLGYDYEEMILDESHGGSLEKRRRYWFVAYSKGLGIDKTKLMPLTQNKVHACLGDVLETEDEPSSWHDLTKFEVRQKKNEESNRNFKMNLVDEKSTSVSTIGRLYSKHQISNPHITNNKGQYRLLSPVEHARVKRVPESLIKHCSDTTAHEGLGQGILYLQAVGLAQAIINALTLCHMKDKKKLSHKTIQYQAPLFASYA